MSFLLTYDEEEQSSESVRCETSLQLCVGCIEQLYARPAGRIDDSFSVSQTEGGVCFSLSDVETNTPRSHHGAPERKLLLAAAAADPAFIKRHSRRVAGRVFL